MSKLERLKGLQIFEGIDGEVVRKIAGYFKLRRYERGEHLWREGDEAVNFTFISGGTVKITKMRNDAREIIVGVFGEGEAVGEVAVYMQVPYPASAVALGDVEALTIYRGHFYGTIQRESKLIAGILHNMMSRNRRLIRRLDEVTTSSAERRLALLFVKFAERDGQPVKLEDGSAGIYVELPLSRRDLCDLINTRVETAIRMMSRWGKEGLVKTEEGGFTILDMEALEEIAAAL